MSLPDLLDAVIQKRPLVQCITNFVSMDLMANVLLAAGASPAMAHSLDEVEDFVGIAAGQFCCELNLPWCLLSK